MAEIADAPAVAEVTAALTAPGQPFEMEEVVIRGIPTRTWKHAPPSLRAVLEASRARGATGFLVYEDDHLSYDEHFHTAAALAHRLVDDHGVRSGDRVAIAMRNFPEWSLAFWAAASVGAVLVPLNAWWTGPELEYGLADSGSVVLFCDAERAERLIDHLPNVPAVRATIVAKPEPDRRQPPGAVAFEEALGEVLADAEPPAAEIDPEDDATIFYTSGTTGRPKGALGTHRNICTNLLSLAYGQARAAARAAQSRAPVGGGDGGQNVSLLSVPFFHATGCHSVLVANLAFAGKIVIMRKWDAGRALELIERERVTTFGGVPAMVWQVLEHPDFGTRDISSVRTIGYGGAPAAPELVRRIEALFPGRTPSNGYGLTETSSVTTLNVGLDYQRKPDSVGVPVPVVDVKVVGEGGVDVPPGEVGELWIKGPNVVKGYWAKPEATAETFTDGWLHSGDVARVDDEGFVYIVDRAKDVIIRGGENVYCVEVEAALFEHPAVTDAAVIGIPHHVLGEEVGAVVHLAPGTQATQEELKTWVAERLAAFNVPVRIWFLPDPLPRNANGKIMKRALKTELLG
jgi:long-chain acyl-CoA synthetase